MASRRPSVRRFLPPNRLGVKHKGGRPVRNCKNYRVLGRILQLIFFYERGRPFAKRSIALEPLPKVQAEFPGGRDE